MKRVSIIVVTYNSEDDVFDCITSIEQYADIPKSDIELIVVDNHSKAPQPMFDRIRELWGDDVLLIENTCNGGYGQGNNVGIRQSTAPVVLIMNPDIRLIAPMFKKVLNIFETDQTLSMYGMKQLNTAGKSSRNSFGCTYMMNGVVRTFITGLCNRFEWFFPRFMYLTGACFFVRKSMFEEIGMFDESNFMYGEEDDIHYRMTKAFGYNIVYDRSIPYVHHTKDRKMTVPTLMKHLDAAKRLNKKNGMSEHETVRHFLEINSTLLFIEKVNSLIGKGNDGQKALLQDFRAELQKQLKA